MQVFGERAEADEDEIGVRRRGRRKSEATTVGSMASRKGEPSTWWPLSSRPAGTPPTSSATRSRACGDERLRRSRYLLQGVEEISAGLFAAAARFGADPAVGVGAWCSHSSPHPLQIARQAWSSGLVTFAS